MSDTMEKVIYDSFVQYSAAVLQSRALVDVRDCIKPSARQIFYCMETDKFTADKPFKKTLKAIGSAMRLFIHGDSSCEGVIMRSSQPFAMRYPLVEVEGSNGNLISTESWAAPRYTASRLSALSSVIFDGLKQDAIDDWRDNYDDTEKYPAVLPSIGYYNICNGTLGIGIAASSSIPAFNLKEVNQAIINLIHDPNASYDKIYCVPDFATGGLLLNEREVYEILKKGQGGSCRLRAVMKYIPDQNMFRVTEMPYNVYTNTVCKELDEQLENNKFIEEYKDLTGKEPCIEIYLKKNVNISSAEQWLYKNTSLENFYTINMTMLDQGRFPKVFGWREALQAYIDHIRICKRREIQFELDKALFRKNIIEGLLCAAANIDDLVYMIRNSNSPTEAAQKLIAKYNFNEEQVKAILAMKLSALTKIDGIKLENEKQELMDKIAEYNHLLTNSVALDEKLIDILQEVADKFGDERRTKVLNISSTVEEVEEPVTVEERDITIYLLNNNQAILQDRNEETGTKRGTKGKRILPKDAEVVSTVYCSNLATLMAFTNQGRMYSFAAHDLETAGTVSLYDIISLKDNELILFMIDGTMMNTYNHLITVSKRGLIKKTRISEYNVKNKKGIAAAKLNEEDELVCAALSVEGNKIIIATNKGYYNYYSVDKISSTGRNTSGVKAIRLNEGEWVQSVALVQNKEYHGVLSISSSGKGKISSLSEYVETSRGVKGHQVMTLGDNETLVAVGLVEINQDKINLINDNKLITIRTSEVPVISRPTIGIKLTSPSNTIKIL